MARFVIMEGSSGIFVTSVVFSSRESAEEWLRHAFGQDRLKLGTSYRIYRVADQCVSAWRTEPAKPAALVESYWSKGDGNV